MPEASIPHASILHPAFQLTKPTSCSFCLGYFPTTKLSPLIKCAQNRPSANRRLSLGEKTLNHHFYTLFRELFPLAPMLVFIDKYSLLWGLPLTRHLALIHSAVAFLSAGDSCISPADTFMDSTRSVKAGTTPCHHCTSANSSPSKETFISTQ